MCHINMLKPYYARDQPEEYVRSVSLVAPVLLNNEDEDVGIIPALGESLQNSNVLNNLQTFLGHLSGYQRESIIKLINNFPSIFSDVPSCTNVLFHDIDVGDAAPVKQHPYRVNPLKRGIMKTEVEYMLRNGLAEPSQSAWSSPCLLVPKAGSSFRFCTDFRKVNSITKPDCFPLPRIDDCIDRVGPAKFVSKLDLLKGYWQVPLTPRAAEISAFVTPDYFCQYSVMAFGMRNAPSTFQRLMQLVLRDVQNCTAYLDDIVVYSSTWEEHVETLGEVFSRLARC